MNPLITSTWRTAASPLVEGVTVQAAQVEITDHRVVEVKMLVGLAEGFLVLPVGEVALMDRGVVQAQRELLVGPTGLCAVEAVGRVAGRQVWDAMMVTQEQVVMEALVAMVLKG